MGKDLITKIESLKNIKPREDWALSVRADILEERNFFSFIFSKPAFAGMATLMLLVGVFVYSNHLDSQRIAQEKELDMIAREGKITELTATLKELRVTRAQLQNQFSQLVISKSEEKTVEMIKQVVPILVEAERQEKLAIESFQLLGMQIEIENEPIDYEKLSAYMINDLKERSLTEEGEEQLVLVEELFNNGDYRSAFYEALGIN